MLCFLSVELNDDYKMTKQENIFGQHKKKRNLRPLMSIKMTNLLLIEFELLE